MTMDEKLETWTWCVFVCVHVCTGVVHAHAQAAGVTKSFLLKSFEYKSEATNNTPGSVPACHSPL